ncbi:MAG: hypothetical protein IH898_08095, partial [Planctomycetes bacterium]|nr:hypothetical protein [Planctomycetota bacterium]
MLRFWQTLAENVVFLMFVMPLVGAGLVVATSRLGLDVIRRTALTNVLLTFSLSILMAANYQPHRQDDSGKLQTIQMVTAVRWPGAGRQVKVETNIKNGPALKQAVARTQQTIGANIRILVG